MSLLAEGALELAASWVGFAQWREARGITDGSVRDLRARADELRRLVELYEPADSRIPPAQRDGEAGPDGVVANELNGLS